MTIKNISNALNTITIITPKKCRNSMNNMLKNKKVVKCKDRDKDRTEGATAKFSAFFMV